MIVTCPQCRRKNRVADSPRPGGSYVCAGCKAPLNIENQIHNKDATRTLSKRGRALIGSLVILNGVNLFILGVLAFFDAIGPERWWLTGFLQFMPRLPLVVPALLLLIPTILLRRAGASLRMRRCLGILPLIALVWTLGPLMGLCLSLPTQGYDPAKETQIRVLTYNVKWGKGGAGEIAREIVREQPDLVQFQDSQGILKTEVGQILTPEKGWTVRHSGQYVVASRWQLSELENLDIYYPGYNHYAVRATLMIPSGQSVTLYNAHLLSPRTGLVSLRARHITGLKENMKNRQFQANKLRQAVTSGPTGPVLLTGDMNAPPHSQVQLTLMQAGLGDAFATAGQGYGYTYGANTKVRQPYVRIDRIFVSQHFRVGAARVGNDRGSDHCPVIADLFLPKR